MKILKKKPYLWAVLAILLVVFVSYGQTLRMYFWQDDSALIFKLQNPEGRAGSFGAGLWERGAYQYLVVPFVPFFKIFGLEPMGYFAIGFLTYFLATAAFYLFAQELLKSKKAGFIATLIFAAGYVGSEIMFRIINSWQSNAGLVLALLSLWALTRFLKDKKKLGYYFLSLFFFWAAVEFVFIRSHSLIFVIFSLDVLLSLLPFKQGELKGFVLRQLPFWFIFYKLYLAGGSEGSSALSSILQSLLNGEIEILASLFATAGNALIQDVFQARFMSLFSRPNGTLLVSAVVFSWLLLSLFGAKRKLKMTTSATLVGLFFLNKYFVAQSLYWYRAKEVIFSGGVGMYGSAIFLSLAFVFWKRQKFLSVALVFGLATLVSQLFGYYIQYPTAVFGTTHRYLNYSLIGYALLWGGIAFALFEQIEKRKWFSKKTMLALSLAPIILLVGTNSILSYKYQARIVTQRSNPTREFYQKLKEYVPEIEKGAVFYFDVASEGFYQQQFTDFFSVGSMPESTALAIYYEADRYDLSMLTNFDELLFKLSEGEAGIEKVYTFFYGTAGLIDTTDRVRYLLKEGSTPQTQFLNVSPTTPMLLILNAIVAPDVEDIEYPYTSGQQRGRLYSVEEKQKMLSYLATRQNYYKNVSANSLSEWRYQEIVNIADNNNQTSWRGNRIWWHNNEHDQVVLDLNRVKRISKVVWTNWNHTLTPTSYTLAVSLKGNSWETVKEVVGGPERGNREVVVEEFQNTEARFVRMGITATLSNDAPAITEIEIVGVEFDDIDIHKAFEFEKNPFGFVEDNREMGMILAKVAPLLSLEVAWYTDKGSFRKDLALVRFGHNAYEVVLPAGGTALKDIKIGVVNAPVKVEVSSQVLQNLSLEKIKTRGLIKEFSEN